MAIAPIIRAYAAKLDVSEGERAVVATLNTDEVDRYGTVIDPSGMDLKQYRSNPVVLWEHGQDVRGKVPIGRAAWVKYDKASRSIVGKTVFNDDEFSDGIFRLYQSECLRGWSVNVLPREWASPSPDEIRKRPELAECFCIYRETELGEYSAVAVPGNASALALAVSRGLWLPDTLKRGLGPPPLVEPPVPELPPLVGRSFGDALEATILAIRASAAQARAEEQARQDLRRGRV
ncbi:MAG: hypothetical protein KGR26_05425 [Cyanobacteria bacterium REEB65]|nr:hypothetical protein [Cyanobacteria bacterium REEB65]